MTELDLHKFVTKTDSEYHWIKKDSHKQENLSDDEKNEVMLFVYTWDIEEFNNLIKGSILDEGGVECRMINDYLTFEMFHICNYFNIRPENVFTDKNA